MMHSDRVGFTTTKGRFDGVANFKYYGEVFDPELSNMIILTAGGGIRPTKKSSIDLVVHKYVQHRASDKLDARKNLPDRAGI